MLRDSRWLSVVEMEGSIDEAAEKGQGQVTENPVHWQFSRAAIR